MKVEAVCAFPHVQHTLTLDLPEDATVAQALEVLRADLEFAALELETLDVGVWGQIVGPDHALAAGDRVEFYRPLVVDPKEARRQRARG